MQTDWLIVRRLGAELDRALRGARIRGAGALPDGRFALQTDRAVVAIDAFGATPIVALERDGSLERRPGWTGTIARALQGLRIDRVRARRGDRLIAFECSARSRFGVASGYRLVVELVPRFGNVVLLRDDTVVCAAKEFSRTANAVRATVTGEPYEPPPLPGAPAGEVPLAAAFAHLATGGDDARSHAVRALRAAVPLVPRLVAESLVAEAAGMAARDPTALAARAGERARALVAATDGDPDGVGDVFCYRDETRLVQCHVVALVQFAGLRCERVPELLPVLEEAIGNAARSQFERAFASKRDALRVRIERRREALVSERGVLERERDDIAGRDALRYAGDLLYAHLADVPPGAAVFVPATDPNVTIALDPALDAKGNAAAYFKRYRKASAKRVHVERRLADLERDTGAVEELAWELARADEETLADVADGVARMERRPTARVPVAPPRRKPLEVQVSGDARVYVGRSPAGNAELTFRIARPDDVWFHARATPGAHVVLRLDVERPPAAHELETAAALAAFHSKARMSDKVPVDYTLRKYVRRQKNAPPGLVWYTHARTLLVAPREAGA